MDAVRLENATVTPAPPRWVPPVFADERAAWDVTDSDGVPFHAEAAALRGHPVWFRLSHEQERPVTEADRPREAYWMGTLFRLVAIAGAGFLAVRNLARKRGDRRGAARIVLFFAVATLVSWVGAARLPATTDAGRAMTEGILGQATLYGLAVGLFYLALEPAARRRWTWRMSAWSRLLAGRVRDPLVGRDVLIGLAAGSVYLVIHLSINVLLSRLTGDPTHTWTIREGVFAQGFLFTVGKAAYATMESGLLVAALFLIILLVVRKSWVVWLVWIVLTIAQSIPFLVPSENHPVAVAVWLVLTIARYGLMAFIFARFGLLAMCMLGFVAYLLRMSPLTTDPSVWYFWEAIWSALLLLALAGYAFYTATGGVNLFKEGFFGDE